MIEKRQSGLLITKNLPGTWSSQGCYVWVPTSPFSWDVLTLSSDVGRTLTQAGYNDNIAMTQESCVAYCWNLGYIYAGVEYSAECCKIRCENPSLRLLFLQTVETFLHREQVLPLHQQTATWHAQVCTVPFQILNMPFAYFNK